MEVVLAFLGVAVLVIVTPGPDTAMTIRSTLLGGRRAGVMTASGVVTGQACWTLAASIGITALLVASEPAFLALKFGGAAYLVYLGVQAILSAIRGEGVDHPAMPVERLPGGKAYRQGLISDLGNPKMAAFFTSLLPQFGTTDAGPSFWLMLAFGLLFCLLTWLWLVLYAAAIQRLGDTLRRRAPDDRGADGNRVGCPRYPAGHRAAQGIGGIRAAAPADRGATARSARSLPTRGGPPRCMSAS